MAKVPVSLARIVVDLGNEDSPMATCQCPACQTQFQAADDRGAFTACPECKHRVQVPGSRRKTRGLWMVWLLLILAAGMIYLTGRGMGHNSNSAFGTVGASIGPITGS